uniref:Putative conserved secreted protein n=1 Tax=Anopheles darlingi TaxID=43151 RepID=A0A2M4DLA4_ANODA
MVHRIVVCVLLLLLSLTQGTLGAPTVHLGPPLTESEGAQTSPDRPNSVADRPYIVEPTWFTVTTSPIDASGGQLAGGPVMPVLPAQPATMRPYVAYIPIAPAYQRHHLPPGWPAYLPGAPLPPYPLPMPSHNQLCNQPNPNGYQLM